MCMMLKLFLVQIEIGTLSQSPPCKGADVWEGHLVISHQVIRHNQTWFAVSSTWHHTTVDPEPVIIGPRRDLVHCHFFL